MKIALHVRLYESISSDITAYWVAVICLAPFTIMSFSAVAASAAWLFVGILALLTLIQCFAAAVALSILRSRLLEDPGSFGRQRESGGPVILAIPGVHWFNTLLR